MTYQEYISKYYWLVQEIEAIGEQLRNISLLGGGHVPVKALKELDHLQIKLDKANKTGMKYFNKTAKQLLEDGTSFVTFGRIY